MILRRLNVTQIRVAATCPRLSWFDARATLARTDGRAVVSRIWRGGGGGSAGGAMFHATVERFNAAAANAPEVLAAIAGASSPEELHQAIMRWFNETCLDGDKLAARPVEVVRAFIDALHRYVEGLARVALHGRNQGASPELVRTQLFGDPRKRVDVTFHVGDGVQVNVTGAVDYVYFDARLGKHRIVDYKLTPASAPKSDLFQVYTYALMHHLQHGTEPDVALFYLHPKEQVIEARWEDVLAARPRIEALLASMVAWSDHAAGKGGLAPPGDLAYCASCEHERSGACVAELGPKDQGAWKDAVASVETRRAPTPAAELPVAYLPPDRDDATDMLVPLPPEVPNAPVDPPRARPSEPELFLGLDDAGARVTLPVSALRTHVSVVGAAGSGKTWMAKVIAEEALRAGVPVVAIDPQGDIVQMMLERPRGAVDASLIAAWEEFHARVEPRILTPGSSHATRLSLDPLRIPTADDLVHIQNPDRRREEEENLLSAVATNLVGLAGKGGDEQVLSTFVYQVLLHMPRGGHVSLADIVRAVMDPGEHGIDEPDLLLKKSERQRLGYRLNAFVQGPAKRLFTGGVKLDFDELLKPSHPGRVPLNVVYLNALASDDEKHFFLAALATELYRWMITRSDASGAGEVSTRTNLLFYIDEARDWIPAGASKPPAKLPIIRLFTQGRKYGVGCLLCTQSPRSVDFNVFGNTSTKLVGRLEAAQDVERVVDWFTTDGGAPPWVAARKGADKGSFVGRWPDMDRARVGRAFKGRQLFTEHAGAWSPDRVEREVAARIKGG